jgi:hypothetical protein
MYTANVQAALTKRGGILSSLVSRSGYSGEKSQVVNFIGPVEFIERDTPYSDTKLTQLEHTQRWITGREYDCAVLVDRLDTLKMIYDPTSPYVERFRVAAARKQVVIIMSAFQADAKTGKDGVTSTPIKAGNTVAHGDTGLSVAKLRALKKLIKKRHIDTRMVKPYFAVSAEEVDDLLGEVAVGSSDYNAVKPLVDGEVSSFMGFQFIPYEDHGDNLRGKSIPQYTDGGSTVRKCPVWVTDGMHHGTWEGLIITINNRPDKNNIKQIHGTMTEGATRLEEDKVYICECKE